jgi:hypothetical protein
MFPLIATNNTTPEKSTDTKDVQMSGVFGATLSACSTNETFAPQLRFAYSTPTDLRIRSGALRSWDQRGD